MKTTRFYYSLLLLFFFTSSYNIVYAYSIRQFSSKNGLSNSAILSMCQDKNGYMWFGSCDGLNMFDGINFQIYKPTNSLNNLSGNLIESVLDAEDDILWIQTNYGLDRFNSRKRTVKTFSDFKGHNKLIKSIHNDIYVVKEDNYIHYYDPGEETFKRIFVYNLVFDNILEMAIDDLNVLWIFLSDGNHRTFDLTRNKQEIRLSPKKYLDHDKPILWCFYEENKFYFVDKVHDLYEFSTLDKRKTYIYNIDKEVTKYGEISSIIKQKNNFFIGFKSSGLIRLEEIPENKNRFSVYEIEIKSGIFSLKKDRYQDIVWVATDGQGVYMYFMNSYSIKSTLFRDFHTQINNPVRALFLDKTQTLWIGTKGDGIVKIHDYNETTNKGSSTEHLLTGNSQLNDNSVYVITPSKKDILWIGTEKGLNYYSYKSGEIKRIPINHNNNEPIRYVHSICEANDSTLWIATVGEGIIKARISGTADNPELTILKHFIFDKGKQSSNYFFTIHKENDSTLWFGNRGSGAYKLNTLTEELDILTLNEEGDSQTLNDVFSIYQNKDGYWIGTSYGLVKMNSSGKQVFNELTGFPNNTIHGILDDKYGNLWLSTNQGIVKFNTTNNTFQTYKQQNELEVTEFSDGASFKNEKTGVMFFGGINGFISIRKNEFSDSLYTPPIQFNRLSIFGKEYNINDFLEQKNGQDILTLDHSQNFFSISFTAVDYINGNDYTYLYRLSELSNNWIENGTSNSAAFTNISPGNYSLQIKYRNNITGNESAVYSLNIRILPPWYKTYLAYFLYSLLFILLVYITIRFILKWYRMKQNNIVEKMNQKQREEIYESKLRFFTNITHEFCTPLTLIYGPCNKILTYRNSDSYINKYAGLIQQNAEKLNSLILELIEFRRLETGNKVLDICRFSVSEFTRIIAESFSELAEAKGFIYEINIKDNCIWNSDKNSLNKIITNLISNAFKYTSDNGKITVELFIEDERLNLVISNTGKGIKEEDIQKIFDRYTILDNFEIQNQKGVSPRNGLGLAICHNLVKLLKGDIHVTSVLNSLTVFRVVLPILEIDISVNESTHTQDIYPTNLEVSSLEFDNILPEYDKSKQTIMIIDDDPSMLWFVTDIFIEQYNVIPINNPGDVFEHLKRGAVDLIITDVMMPDIDGISLTKSIKSDKHLNQIPLVLLSAKRDIKEQVRGIDSGAEVYITKPFDVEYLEKIVSRLLQRKEDLKEYYGSVLSAFELKNGRLTHVEDNEFYEKVLKEIDTNISNPNLSVEMLSQALGCSTRQFYRKLKAINEKTPSDLIKEYRLKAVERLLVTTNLSIDEILYKTGFVNRGNFFKIFSQEYGMTPKSYRDQKKREMI